MTDNAIELDSSESPPGIRFSSRFNVAAPFIDRHLREGRGDKVVIYTSDGGQVTYAELAEQVNRCGNGLLGLGLTAGQRIVMIVKDCPAFFYCFWGAIKAGLVPVPLNTLLRADDFAFMLADSGGSALVYSPEYSTEVEAALKKMDDPPVHLLCVDGAEGSLEHLLSGASPMLSPADTAADDDCFWLYTSGSTGMPKGAIHRHRDMVVASQRCGVETLDIGECDLCFSAAKLFFAYGLGNGMTFPLWVGGSVVLYDGRPDPESTFEMIERFEPTVYFGVPTLYAAQLQALEQRRPNLSSLRYCVSAGEALPANILERWRQQTKLTVVDGIGSTEALHLFISNRPGDVKAGTSGRPVPGYEAKIVDEGGAEVADNESGQLLIRGDSTAYCYWNRPQKTAETMMDGWLKTGDTYFRDDDGYYHYCGRDDDMLKVGGIWCSPFEIEARLIEHPVVLEAAVVAQKDDAELVKPAAYIVLTDDAAPGSDVEQQLREHCKTGLAPYKYPRWIYFVNELPKTATGKIQRFKLRG
ncbi:MAG: benzoate-CoA ligase family protein [Halieaceae bacterium]|jgi:benzoate-CoA ligase family protein|nr:benzoate-CoA ligase family protein [Halieaceae bacterium]